MKVPILVGDEEMYKSLLREDFEILCVVGGKGELEEMVAGCLWIAFLEGEPVQALYFFVEHQDIALACPDCPQHGLLPSPLVDVPQVQFLAGGYAVMNFNQFPFLVDKVEVDMMSKVDASGTYIPANIASDHLVGDRVRLEEVELNVAEFLLPIYVVEVDPVINTGHCRSSYCVFGDNLVEEIVLGWEAGPLENDVAVAVFAEAVDSLLAGKHF